MIAAAARPARRRRWALLLPLLALPVAVLAGAAGVVVAYSYRLTNPPEYAPLTPAAGTTTDAVAAYRERNPRSEHGLEFRDVEFRAVDGTTLRGWLVPSGIQGRGDVPGPVDNGIGIVAAHARAGDRRDYLDQLPLFHRLGATVLLVDYREHGVSDGSRRGMALGWREAEDLAAAARYLRSTAGTRRVVVVGHSLGGSAAILAAAQHAAIDGVLAESSIADFRDYVYGLGEEWLERRRLDHVLPRRPRAWAEAVVGFTARRLGVRDAQPPVDVVERIAPRPLLLVHGTADTIVRPAHSERLFERAGAGRDLWLAPGAEHNGAFTANPDEYATRLAALLTRVSQEPRNGPPPTR